MGEFTEKWEKTGLLQALEGKRKDDVALLLENQSQWFISASDAANDSDKLLLERWVDFGFPIIRRVFGGDLKFEYEVTSLPSFLHEGKAYAMETHCIRTNVNLPNEALKNYSGFGLNTEVEITAQLASEMTDKFNELFEGEKVIFFTPLMFQKMTNDNWAIVSRLKVVK